MQFNLVMWISQIHLIHLKNNTLTPRDVKTYLHEWFSPVGLEASAQAPAAQR